MQSHQGLICLFTVLLDMEDYSDQMCRLIRTSLIASDRTLFFQHKRIDIFLVSIQNICCGYSLEASNEYPQHMFS